MRTTELQKPKRRTKAVTLDTQKRLHELARAIRDTYDATEKLLMKAQSVGTETIAEAIQCGLALVEAKKIVGHGDWLVWLAKHCKLVKVQTAQRYMRLARSNTLSITYFKHCKTLREAYILVGIIPEIDPSEIPQDSPPTPEMRVEIGRAGGETGQSPSDVNTVSTRLDTCGQPLTPGLVATAQQPMSAAVPESEPPDLRILRRDVTKMIKRLASLTPEKSAKAKDILKPIGAWL